MKDDNLRAYVNSLYGQALFNSDAVKIHLSADQLTKLEGYVKPEPEEWIWVEGYKGTDANMKCRDFQFKMNKQFDMPEDAKIKICDSGFHLCRDLKDVFTYYDVGGGNRYFRVRALVRKKDFENYGKRESDKPWEIASLSVIDKLVSKSIVFLYELNADEILKENRMWDLVKDFTNEEKEEVLKYNFERVKRRKNAERLVAAGYSQGFAEYIAYDLDCDETVNIACKVATQPGLSMDMKALMILRGRFDD